MQASEARVFTTEEKQEHVPWVRSFRDLKYREGASVDNDSSYSMGNIHETPWFTSKHFAVIPESPFVGLPSDPEGDLHSLSVQK